MIVSKMLKSPKFGHPHLNRDDFSPIFGHITDLWTVLYLNLDSLYLLILVPVCVGIASLVNLWYIMKCLGLWTWRGPPYNRLRVGLKVPISIANCQLFESIARMKWQNIPPI